jgi:acetoacetyl-CoA synthetase
MTASGQILWQADEARRRRSEMVAFRSWLNQTHDKNFSGWDDLYAWSVSDLAGFWAAAASYTKIKFHTGPAATWQPPPPGRMVGATWFPGAALNYAENLLAGGAGIVAYAEGGNRRELSADHLRLAVARCAAGLRALGVVRGDRVAGVIANVPEAVIAMLATASIGAVWSSCSPDFGVEGVVDRLSQVAPKVVFVTTGYCYNGKMFDCRKNITAFTARLPGLSAVVAVNHLPDDLALRADDVAVAAVSQWDDFLPASPPPMQFASLPFDHPLFIMFSSGTTGVPKCIVHGAGGTLLQHKKELVLHSDLKPGDRLLYFTTCGWMMWNWMVSALSAGVTLVLFEGSLSHPDLDVLWAVVGREKVTALGTSPKFIGACMNARTSPRQALAGHMPATILSTGSPLLPEHFTWIYDHVGKDVHLASICGGTDIISCFMLGNPLLPVRAGEIQAAGLGMDIDVWDDEARPVRAQKGELVCKSPFVSMPVGFWNDPDGSKYHEAYFDYYQDRGIEVWRHGDYVEMTPSGGIIVYGRSDATLNPGGVRIGTAEIYRQVETLPEVADSLAIGRLNGDDTDVVLFVKLNAGVVWSDDLSQRIKGAIRRNLTPRHTPREVIPVSDIPYTRSGKKVELAVTKVIHGEVVKNVGALANPESLAEYHRIRSERWP